MEVSACRILTAQLFANSTTCSHRMIGEFYVPMINKNFVVTVVNFFLVLYRRTKFKDHKAWVAFVTRSYNYLDEF